MRLLRLLLPLLILAAGLRADEPAAQPAEPVKRSPDVLSKMTDVMPKYNPPPPVEAKPAPLTPNPDVLELPKMTVKQKPRPRLNQEIMSTPAAFNQKLAKDNLSAFDRDFLNKLTLPSWFGGQSAADRAREEYERKKRDDLLADVLVLSKAAEQLDPAKAKALRDDAAKPMPASIPDQRPRD